MVCHLRKMKRQVLSEEKGEFECILFKKWEWLSISRDFLNDIEKVSLKIVL